MKPFVCNILVTTSPFLVEQKGRSYDMDVNGEHWEPTVKDAILWAKKRFGPPDPKHPRSGNLVLQADGTWDNRCMRNWRTLRLPDICTLVVFPTTDTREEQLGLMSRSHDDRVQGQATTGTVTVLPDGTAEIEGTGWKVDLFQGHVTISWMTEAVKL